MGDLICLNCGDAWDAYGARCGDMRMSEYRMLINGEGCPTCKGKPIYNCELEGTNCEHFQYGQCKYEGACDHKSRHRVELLDDWAQSLMDNTDGDEAQDAFEKLEFKERFKI